MAQPAYVLNTAHFEALLVKHGYGNKSGFVAKTGISRRTFHSVLSEDRELTGKTIRVFMEAFPGCLFENLFVKPRRDQIPPA